jgi:hypothetical protein
VGNPSKRKGTKFESEVVAYLQSRGFEACERRALTGTQDRGDIAGIQGWMLECKNHNSHDFAAWMDEAEKQRNPDEFGLLVVRRRLKTIDKAYAVLPFGDMVSLMGGN